MGSTVPAGVRRLTIQHVILFLVGVGLSVAQFVMIRDFVTVLYGEEVVIVLVTAAFFAGLSIGYLMSLRLAKRVFEYLFVASVFLHLTLPFSYRYLAAWFASMSAGGYAYLALLFLYALLFTSVFAAFLPRLVTLEGAADDAAQRLKQYYSVELLGFIVGFFIVVLSWNQTLMFLLPVYWLVLALLLHLVIKKFVITAAYAVAIACSIVFLAHADFHSSSLLYQYKHNRFGSRVLYSVNSPYQKVEVTENRLGARALFLDGLQNLNSTDLDALNYYIAVLPAALIRPKRALLIGNGTLSSVPKIYPFSGEVVSVELDPGVLQASYFFVDPERLKNLDRWQLHTDDGKHFLLKSREKFDLIIMDIPSPLTIQEAVLHTAEFYRLAQSRLSENGVITVQLSGTLHRNNRSSAQITAALKAAFKDVMVVTSEKSDRSFAYASMRLPFSSSAVRAYARSYESRPLTVIEPAEIASYLALAQPLAIDNLDLVLRRGWERFTDRYFSRGGGHD